MTEEERWNKVRQIVREECERISQQIVEVIEKHKKKPRIDFKNGRFTGLGELELEALQAAYPAVEVGKQLKEMAAWILLNPDDAPKSNYGAFVNRWLSKHQNQHSLRSIPTQVERKPFYKMCGYCDKRSIGSVNGIEYCNEHSLDAMDQKPRRMLGVVAKPVAGS